MTRPFRRFRSSRFTVKFGEFLLTNTDPGESQVYQVIDVKIHPNFSYRGFYNDLALLRLDRPVEFNEYVQPICLPSSSQSTKAFVGEVATVAGWGSTYYGIHLHVDGCARGVVHSKNPCTPKKNIQKIRKNPRTFFEDLESAYLISE